MCSAGDIFEKVRYGTSSIDTAFRSHGIVPEFIDTAPKEYLRAAFSSGFEPNLGNTGTPTATTFQPKFIWNCNPDSYYTIHMFDGDVTGRESRLLSEAVLLTVGNIHGCDIYNGEVLTDWFPPVPQIGTGAHRLILLLYKQPKKIYFEEPFIRF